MDPARFFPPRWQLLLHALGAGLLAAVGLLMASSDNGFWQWTGALLAAVFAAATGVLLARAVRPGPTVVIDAEGIVDRTALVPAGRLRWDEIAAVRKREIGKGMGRERLLEIVLREPGRFRTRPRSLPWRVAAGYRDLIKQPQVSIPASMVDRPMTAVIGAIRRHRPLLDVMELPPPRPGLFSSLFSRPGRGRARPPARRHPRVPEW